MRRRPPSVAHGQRAAWARPARGQCARSRGITAAALSDPRASPYGVVTRLGVASNRHIWASSDPPRGPALDGRPGGVSWVDAEDQPRRFRSSSESPAEPRQAEAPWVLATVARRHQARERLSELVACALGSLCGALSRGALLLVGGGGSAPGAALGAGICPARAEAGRAFQLTAPGAFGGRPGSWAAIVVDGPRARTLPGRAVVFAAADDESATRCPWQYACVRETWPSKRARLDMGAKERRVGSLYMGVSRSERPERRPRKGAS